MTNYIKCNFPVDNPLAGKTTMQITMKNPISYAYPSVQVPKSF